MNRDGTGTITISRHARLAQGSSSAILERIPKSDPESKRRQRMAVDADIIRRASTDVAFLRIEEWINKGLNWRGAEIAFDDPDGRAEVDYPFMAAGYSLPQLLAELFPWADCEYDRAPENHAGEVDVHTFELSINELGRAFLFVEDFYKDGAVVGEEPDPPESDDELTEDEWNEMMMRRAIEKDPY